MTPLERQLLIRDLSERANCREQVLARFTPILGFLSRIVQEKLGADPKRVQDASWAMHLRKRQRLSRRSSISDFQRIENRKGWALYKSGTEQSDTILICWQGMAGRLMMPIADFLQALPENVDVLMIKYLRPAGYIAGIPGLGKDLPNSIANLGEKIRRLNYETVISLGSSAGTAPALFSSLQTKSKGAILFGPFDTNADEVIPSWNMFLEKWTRAQDNGETMPQIIYLVGSDSSRDNKNGESIRSFVGGEIQKVPRARHNVLEPMLQSGNLAPWLASRIQGLQATK